MSVYLSRPLLSHPNAHRRCAPGVSTAWAWAAASSAHTHTAGAASLYQPAPYYYYCRSPTCGHAASKQDSQRNDAIAMNEEAAIIIISLPAHESSAEVSSALEPGGGGRWRLTAPQEAASLLCPAASQQHPMMMSGQESMEECRCVGRRLMTEAGPPATGQAPMTDDNGRVVMRQGSAHCREQ